MNLRVLPVGVAARPSVSTSIDLLLKPVEALVVAQVAAGRRDVADVEVNTLGVAEVVAASEALTLVEVGWLDGTEVARFGKGVFLLLGPTFATRVAAAFGELVSGLRALNGGAGGEGCGQSDEEGGELHVADEIGGWWEILIVVDGVCLCWCWMRMKESKL